MATITEKIDNITKVPKEYMSARLPAPKSVKIELTADCNLRCTFCTSINNLRDQNVKSMDIDFFKSITKDLKEYGVEEIGLFYLGESMLYPHLEEAIRYLKEDLKFEWVFLTTNGVFATKDRITKIMAAGLDSLKFSVNYSSGEQFQEITKRPSSQFNTLIDNIKSTHAVREDNKFKCIVSASSVKYDEDQIGKMEPIIKMISPYIDEHYWLPVYSSAGEGYGIDPGNTGRLDNPRKSLPCWVLFTEGHITSDGAVAACSFDYNGKFSMGNLKEKSFSECWNSPEFVELRAKHLKGDVSNSACSKCILGK